MKMSNYIKIRQRIKPIIPVLMVLLTIHIMSPAGALAQVFMGKNKVFLIGQVVNQLNGAPLKYQKVIVEADSSYEPNFVYSNIVYTDQEGYYYDTIQTYNVKGALKVSTVDFQNNTHDTTVFYRFNWSEDNILFANFALPCQQVPIVYQANFYYIKNPNGNNTQEYKFVDITNSQNIVSYEWDFGDGVISYEQNPTHIFGQGGLNKVSLKVEIQNSPTSKPYISNLVKVINVTSTYYFHMGGHVFAGYFPIDLGHAYLYKIENSELILIDTATFNDELGFYLFYQLIEGEYIVKADLDPSSELFNQFMGTYYGDKILWTQADTIFHESSVYEYDIHLNPNEKSMTGPGVLAGEINYTGGGDDFTLPADNISIILYDDNNEAVDVCHSNESGEFELIDLDMDIYYLYAEVTGKYSQPLYVELSGTNAQITKIEFSIEDNIVTGVIGYAGVNENAFNEQVSQAYPNPVANDVFLNVENITTNNLRVALISASGETLHTCAYSNTAGIGTISLPMANLPKGIYFIQISDGTGQTITRKIIK